MPLRITFKEPLDCYGENCMDILSEKLAGYAGALVEARLREETITEDFLEHFCRLDRLFRDKGKDAGSAEYEIQTTGAGMTSEQAGFFKEHDITVCLLMDGPKDAHKRSNIMLKRAGLHEQTVRAAELLTRYDVNFYIGITVTSATAANVQTVFSFLIDNGWNSLAFWPAICEADQKIRTELLSADEYQYFMEQLFRLWKDKRMEGQPVYIREFENLAGSIKGYAPLVSSMCGQCPFQNVFLPNGAFYARGCMEGQQKYLCKQLREQDWQMTKNSGIRAKCKNCRWVSLCQSDRTCCMNTSMFCETYQAFYQTALPGMFELLRRLGR